MLPLLPKTRKQLLQTQKLRKKTLHKQLMRPPLRNSMPTMLLHKLNLTPLPHKLKLLLLLQKVQQMLQRHKLLLLKQKQKLLLLSKLLLKLKRNKPLTMLPPHKRVEIQLS